MFGGDVAGRLILERACYSHSPRGGPFATGGLPAALLGICRWKEGERGALFPTF